LLFSVFPYFFPYLRLSAVKNLALAALAGLTDEALWNGKDCAR
jgi:hypothetical protein